MYIDKFQIKKVRFPRTPKRKKHPKRRRVRNVKAYPLPISQQPAFIEINDAKIKQYRRVKAVARELLQLKSYLAFEIIYNEFNKYNVLAEKEEKYLVRKGQMSILQFLMIHKTIADIWWALPEQTRQLWDSVPELKAWREKYR